MSSHSLFTQGNEQNYTTSFVNAETMNIPTTVLKLTVLVPYALTADWGRRRRRKARELLRTALWLTSRRCSTSESNNDPHIPHQ